MNCHDFQTALARQAEGMLSALERHRQRCSDCARFAERMVSAGELLGRPANANALPPSNFAARVAAGLPERENPLTWAALRLLPATTALALALLGWCWLTTPSPVELWTEAGDDQVLIWVLSGE